MFNTSNWIACVMTNICTEEILPAITSAIILRAKHLSMTCACNYTCGISNYVHVENNS